jgi:thioredoxin reductase
MHGFLTRDGVATEQFLALALGELKRYPSVTMDVCEVALAKRTDSGFEVRLTTGEAIHSRRLLLATGLFDELPKIPGIEDYFGISVFQCPYCDGWEVQDQTLVGYGKGERGIEMARALTAWSNDIILCLDGSGEIPPEESAALLKDKIRIFEQPVVAIHGKKGVLESLEIVDGTRIHAKTMLF